MMGFYGLANYVSALEREDIEILLVVYEKKLAQLILFIGRILT
jgi:hypothetical protein